MAAGPRSEPRLSRGVGQSAGREGGVGGDSHEIFKQAVDPMMPGFAAAGHRAGLGSKPPHPPLRLPLHRAGGGAAGPDGLSVEGHSEELLQTKDAGMKTKN